MGRSLGIAGVSVLALSSLVVAAASVRLAAAGEGPPKEAATKEAAAKEAAAKYAALEAQIKGHLGEKALDALKKDVEEVSKALAEQADPKQRTRHAMLLGTITNGTLDEGVRRVAIVAIGNSKEGALFQYLRRFLAQPDLDAEPPLCKVAIEAAGKLLTDDAVLPLMTIIDKTHVMSLAQAAMAAFSKYGFKKNVRGKILRDLVATLEKDRPGTGLRWDASMGDPTQTAKTRTNEMSRQRWDALSGVLVTTLNTMTGTQAATAEDWFKLYDDYKGGLDRLFVDPAR